MFVLVGGAMGHLCLPRNSSYEPPVYANLIPKPNQKPPSPSPTTPATTLDPHPPAGTPWPYLPPVPQSFEPVSLFRPGDGGEEALGHSQLQPRVANCHKIGGRHRFFGQYFGFLVGDEAVENGSEGGMGLQPEVDLLALAPDEGLAERQNGRMAEWQNGRTAEWQGSQHSGY